MSNVIAKGISKSLSEPEKALARDNLGGLYTQAEVDNLIANADAGAINGVFYENDQTVSTNYTITAGKNAMSAGDITIADGVTVTVPDGSTWSIV